MARFVIVVDTQKDFMARDGALSVAGAEALVEPMRKWLGALDPDDTAGVLFTFDTHLPDVYANSPEAEAFPIHCLRASEGWNNLLAPAHLAPEIPAWRLEKGVFDMWEEDGLLIEDARAPTGERMARDAFFSQLQARGVDTVRVIGVAADYCVRWAIDGLVARGFRVTIPTALTRGIERQIDQVLAENFPEAPVSLEA